MQVDALRGIALGIVTAWIAVAITSVYLHRGLTHGAVHFSWPAAIVFRIGLWMLIGIRPAEWVALHRVHHRYPDLAADPHSPYNFERFGRIHILFGSIVYYRRVKRDRELISRYARDIIRHRDPLDRLFDRGFLGPALLITTGIILSGRPWFVLVAAATHLAVYITMQGVVNAFGHASARPAWNPATAPRGAIDRPLLGVLTFGESQHNFHHQYPRHAVLSARLIRDPGGALIRGLSRCGLATYT